MSCLEENLQKWADSVEQSLPMTCPKCGCKLDQIRYAHDRNRMTVHLTGVTNEHDYYTARCPSCDHILAAHTVDDLQTHWKG